MTRKQFLAACVGGFLGLPTRANESPDEQLVRDWLAAHRRPGREDDAGPLLDLVRQARDSFCEGLSDEGRGLVTAVRNAVRKYEDDKVAWEAEVSISRKENNE